MRLVVSGPISHQPDLNRHAFREATAALRACGYDVTNPHELHDRTDLPWATYMRASLRAVVEADGVALLPRWGVSRGALLERLVAVELGMEALTWGEWVERAREAAGIRVARLEPL